MEKTYFSIVMASESEADIYIFGDITSWPWIQSDVSAWKLANQVKDLDVERINVHISSYGGEVAEGLAIYNTLKNHKAKIKTICEGFACSAASVVFMAGADRVMNAASLLMIHNAWTVSWGDANDLRKEADDLEKISDTAANAYREGGVALSDEDLKALLDAETWITPAEALEWGFATTIHKAPATEKAAASARAAAYNMMVAGRAASGKPPEKPKENAEGPPGPEPKPGPENEGEATAGAAAGRQAALIRAMTKFLGKGA